MNTSHVQLFYAVHKRTNQELGVSDVTPGQKQCLTTRDKSAWVNAALEDWDFIDNFTDGWFFDRYELVACQKGTPLTVDSYDRGLQ